MKTLFAGAAAAALLAGPALAQETPGMQMGPAKPAPAEGPPARPDPPMADHDMDGMPGMDHAAPAPGRSGMAGMDMGEMVMPPAALGAYSMMREASGTSWQPDASPMEGSTFAAGGWSMMAHAVVNGVYDWQGGARGGEGRFVSGMAMLMGRRQLAGGDTLSFNVMLSPDPLMGRRGYPLLLASGETANGATPLVDRQHPHDLFMELSGAYSRRLANQDSVFVYAGLPAEPAFGPPAFMHRLSIMDSPEAPISHHWLDSTHVTFGVVTAGYIHGDWKLEVSRFKGREPDPNRWDIETPKLDSTAARISWNPSANLALQASWAELKSPEQLEPEQNQRRWSASAIYTRQVGQTGWWSTTLAWGQRSSSHGQLPAYVLESALHPDGAWTLFGRAEQVKNDELVADGPAYVVGKVSVGAVRDWPVSSHVSFGAGGLYAWNFVPTALAAAYGSGDPQGAMAFVRLKLQ